MPIREVLNEQWTEFFQAFTSEHEGQLVSFGIDGRQPVREIVAIEAHELPLREITMDVKDDKTTVFILLQLPGDKVMRHAIPSVSHIHITQADNGAETVLEVLSLNGQTNTLNLSAPISLNL